MAANVSTSDIAGGLSLCKAVQQQIFQATIHMGKGASGDFSDSKAQEIQDALHAIASTLKTLGVRIDDCIEILDELYQSVSLYEQG